MSNKKTNSYNYSKFNQNNNYRTQQPRIKRDPRKEREDALANTEHVTFELDHFFDTVYRRDIYDKLAKKINSSWFNDYDDEDYTREYDDYSYTFANHISKHLMEQYYLSDVYEVDFKNTLRKVYQFADYICDNIWSGLEGWRILKHYKDEVVLVEQPSYQYLVEDVITYTPSVLDVAPVHKSTLVYYPTEYQISYSCVNEVGKSPLYSVVLSASTSSELKEIIVSPSNTRPSFQFKKPIQRKSIVRRLRLNLEKSEHLFENSTILNIHYSRLLKFSQMDYEEFLSWDEESSERAQLFGIKMWNILQSNVLRKNQWYLFHHEIMTYLHSHYPQLRLEQYEAIDQAFVSFCEPQVVIRDYKVRPLQGTTYVEKYTQFMPEEEVFTNVLLQPKVCEEQEMKYDLIKYQQMIHEEKAHYHSLYCQCQKQKYLPLPRFDMGLTRNGVYSPLLDTTLPDSTTIKECIEEHMRGAQQAEGAQQQNPLVTRLTQMLVDHLTDSLLSKWQGITIAAGAISSLASLLVAIIFLVLDLIKNGCNVLKVTSLVAMFVSLASQAAVAVGAGCLLTSFPDIGSLIAQLFGGLEEGMTLREASEALIDPGSLPFVEQVQQYQAHEKPNPLNMKYDISSLVSRTTKFEITIDNEKHGCVVKKMPKDGTCGFRAIIEGLELSNTVQEVRDFLADNIDDNDLKNILKVPIDRNGHISSAGWFTSDLCPVIAQLFNINIEVYIMDTVTRYSTDGATRTVKLLYDSGHFDLLVRPQKQGVPSIETFITVGTGIVGLALSLASCAGNKTVGNFQKNYIQSHRFKTALKSDVTDVKELVESISQDCFGYHMGSFAKLKERILEITERMGSFMSQPNTYYAAHPQEYFKYRDTMLEATELLTSVNCTSAKMPNYLVQALAMLSADVASVKATFRELGKAMLSGRPRQEPVPLMVVGRQGIGKTWFLRKYLIKQLQERFGWSDNVYSLSFSGQVYFKPYSGQEVCFYDEFLALQAEDPLIPHINGICSIDQYNMPGAELWTKVQECLFKSMILVSNRHHCSLLTKLSEEAQMALYSRMQRIEIINKSAPMDDRYTRDQITHTEDFSEFEIRWYLLPPTSKSPKCARGSTKPGIDTRSLADPYVIITKEQLLEYVSHKIACKEAEFYQRPMPEIEGEPIPQYTNPIPKKINPGLIPNIPLASVEEHNQRVSLAHTALNKEPIEEVPPALEVLSADEVVARLEQLKTEVVAHKVYSAAFYNDLEDMLERVINTGEHVEDMKTILVHLMKKDENFKDIDGVEVFIEQYGEPEEQVQGDTDSPVDHMVVLLSGQTDTGKSVLATNLAYKLSRVLKMPVYNVTQQKLSDVLIERPSVVVLHDKMDNEQDYIQFYDALKKPSIIINTNNLRFTRGWSMVETEQEVDRTDSITNRIMSKAINFLASIHRSVFIKPHSNAVPEPGFARRVGVHGYISHAGCQHYRTPETTEWWNVKKYGRLCCPDGTKEITKVELIDSIVSKYRVIHAGISGIKFIEGPVTITDADVVLRFESVEQAQSYVNNPCKILSLFSKYRDGKNLGIAPELSISRRVINSSFIFNASMFAINDFTDLESVKEMAQSSYALLMKGSSEFTCLLDLTTFKAYCEDQVITWEASGSISDSVIVYTHDIKYNNEIRYPVVELQLYQGSEETKVLYNADNVANIILNGIQEEVAIPVSHALYFADNEKQIMSHPLMQGSKVKYAPKRVLLKQVTEEASIFHKIWKTFTESKWFTVLNVILWVMLALSGIYMLLGIAKMIYSWCKGPVVVNAKNTFEMPLYVDGRRIRLTATATGSEVNVDVVADEPVATDELYDICNEMVEEHLGKEYTLGQVKYVYVQSDVSEQKNLAKKGKKLAKKPVRVISNAIKNTQAQISDSQCNIMAKVLSAGVWVKGTRSSSYGLRWKNLEIITPAHLWNTTGEKGTLNLPLPDGTIVTVACLVYFVDHDNDIALARIQDKSGRGGRNTIPMASDLTKYFMLEKHQNLVSSAVLITRQVNASVRPYTFHNALPIAMAGYLQISELNATKDIAETRQLVFTRANVLDILTKAGDCGSPYISIDPVVDHHCIVGLHSSLMPCGRQSIGSVITQEYLSGAVAMSIKGAISQGGVLATERDLTQIDPVDMEWFPPHTQCYAKGYGMTQTYVEWYDALDEVYQEEDDPIWYDAEDRPDANVRAIGYDKKHKPVHIGKDSHQRTPWSKNLESKLPMTKWLSVVDSTKHSDPTTLKKLNGKPSVLATQIEKYSDPIIIGDEFEKLLEVGKECLYQDCKFHYSGGLRILTDLEVVNGTYINPRDKLFAGLEPLDLETSAGDYPARKWNITTKTPLFRNLGWKSVTGRDLYTWNNTIAANDVQHSVYNTEFWAEAGIRVITPMKDCLKREIVAKKDKSRLFTALSIEDTMLGRKYTGAIQARVMQEHMHAHTQIGINPYTGFHHLYLRFKKISLYGEAGDFARWDKHLSAQVLKAAFDVCKRLYQDELPEKRDLIENVYNVMADQMLNSLSIADGVAYFKNRGMPSGCPVTALMNSFANDIMMYMCIQWLVNHHNEDLKRLSQVEYDDKYHPLNSPFEHMRGKREKVIHFSLDFVNKHFDWATYGDDFVSAISVKYLWLVNFVSRRRFYREVVGMDYDLPTKEGFSGDMWYTELHNLEFISRTFRREAGLTFAALKKSSIESLLHWTRTKSVAQYEANFHDALFESVNWGEEYYNKIAMLIMDIQAWLKRQGVHVRCSVSPWNVALQDMISRILVVADPFYPEIDQKDGSRVRQLNPEYGTSIEQILLTESNLESDLTERISKCQQLEKQRMAQGVKTPLVLLQEVNQITARLDYSKCKEITKVASFPAYIVDSSGVIVNICFQGKTYAQFDHVQSDLAKVVLSNVAHLVVYKKVTLCERSLDGGKSIAPVWQCQFTLTAESKTPTHPASKPLGQNLKMTKQRQAQASGTQTRTDIQDGNANQTDNVVPIRAEITRGVPKGQLMSTIWERDIPTIAHEYMETPDSPLSIAISTPAHTVIFTRCLNDMRNMPPAMRTMAQIHTASNKSRFVKLKFITAATLINELVFGVAAQCKTTYTIQELQLIKWVAINPQDNSVEIQLDLANVDWGRAAGAATTTNNVNVNRYRFQDMPASMGTDESPYDMPTLVVMTRVGIQNSYANPDVSIQIAIQEKFGAGHFIVDGQKLNEGLPATSVLGLSSTSSYPLSEWLNLEAGRPFNMTCDGGQLPAEKPVNVEIDSSMFVAKGEATLHGHWYAMNNTTNTPELRARASIPLTASAWTLPVYDINDREVTVGTFKYTLKGWHTPPLHQHDPPNPTSFWNTMGLVHPSRNGSGSWLRNATVAATPVLPSLTLVAQSLTGGASYPRGEESTIKDRQFEIDIQKLIVDIQGSDPITLLHNLIDSIQAYDDEVRTAVPETTISYEMSLGSNGFDYDDGSINDARPVQIGGDIYTNVVTLQAVASVLVEYYNEDIQQVIRCLISLVPSTASITVSGVRDLACTSVFTGNASIYPRDVADTNWLGPQFGVVMNTHFRLLTNIQLLTGTVIEAKRNLTSSLDPNFVRLAFPITTPKTLSVVLANEHIPVEYDDTTFLTAFKRKLAAAGTVASSNQLIMFNLNMIVGGTIAIVVVYDPIYDAFFINNSPSTSEDYYKAFRKLTFEDVTISQIRTIQRISSSIPVTRTTNWINRVATSTNTLFTGNNMVPARSVGKAGKLRTHYKRRVAQAEMAAAAAAGFTSQIFASIFSYLSSKSLLDAKIQGDLQKLQAQFENAEKLQNQKFQQQLELQGLVAQSYKSSYPGLGSANTSVAPPTQLQTPNNDYGLNFDTSGKVIQPQSSTTASDVEQSSADWKVINSPSALSKAESPQVVLPPSTEVQHVAPCEEKVVAPAQSPVATDPLSNMDVPFGHKPSNDWLVLTGPPQPKGSSWLRPITTRDQLLKDGTIHIGRSSEGARYLGQSIQIHRTRPTYV